MIGGLAFTLLANRVRMPALVVFIGVGMAIGSDGLGLVSFSDFELAQQIGIVALVLILFEGGLSAGFSTIRPVLGPSFSLATIGTLGTAAITGVAATWLFDLSFLEGLLLGSVIASTDAAAVFSILRGSTLRRRIAATLEGEAGFNDPIAVILVVGFITLIQEPDQSAAYMVVLLIQNLGVGGLVGLAVGRLGLLLMEKVRFQSAGLYPVASVAVAAIAFGAAQELGGSGFLSVYLAGLSLASPRNPVLRTIETFQAGLAWLAQIGMFLMLGLLVFPSQLPGIALEGFALAIIVALVARPIATWVATIGQGFSPGDRMTIGWAGLRGAVPTVLATFAVVEGVEQGYEFFNIVFFAVIVSVLFQGMTLTPVARRLGSTTEESAIPVPLTAERAIKRLGAETIEFPVKSGDTIVGKQVSEMGLSPHTLLTLVVRRDTAILPRGDTVIHAGDLLEFIVRQEAALDLRDQFRAWREGDKEG